MDVRCLHGDIRGVSLQGVEWGASDGSVEFAEAPRAVTVQYSRLSL